MALTVIDTGFSLYNETFLGASDGTSYWGHIGFADGSVWHKYDKPTGVNGCMGYRLSEGSGLAYLFYTPQNLNFNTTYAGFHISIWIYCADPSRLKSLTAGGGLFLVAGSSTSDYKKFLIASGDSYDQLENGFTKFTFDPRNIATSTVGTPNLTNICLFGVFADTTLNTERYNIFIGGITLEGTLTVTGTSTSFWNDLSTLNKSRVYKLNDTYFIHGGVIIGNTIGSVATDVSDNAKKVVFRQSKYYRGSQWYSTRASESGGLTFVDGTSSSTRFVDGNIIIFGIYKFGVSYSEGYADKGSVFECKNGLAGSLISNSMTNSSSYVRLYGTLIEGFSSGCSFPPLPLSCRVVSAQFVSCGEINPGGAVFRDCKFIRSVSLTAALIWSVSTTVTYSKFLSNTACPAVKFSPYYYFYYFYDNEFYGNTTDLQNLDSQNVRVRFKEGTWITTTSGNITLQPHGTITIQGSVSLLGAEVRIYALDGASGDFGTLLAGTESNSSSTYSFSDTYNSDCWLQILKAGYKEFGVALNVLYCDYTYEAHLEQDKNL